jgi:hypothetical protein
MAKGFRREVSGNMKKKFPSMEGLGMVKWQIGLNNISYIPLTPFKGGNNDTRLIFRYWD